MKFKKYPSIMTSSKFFLCFVVLLIMGHSCQVFSEEISDFVLEIKNAFQAKDFKTVSNRWYSVGGTPGDKVFIQELLSKKNTKKWVVDVQLKRFDEHKPEGEFPAPIDGKKQVWLKPPTHWIFVKCNKDPLEEGFKYSFNFTFGAGKIEEKWFIIGSKTE